MKVKKLKSFTVLEALISLMLMGIIIALTYSLFNVLGKQMTLFEKENVSELQYNLFNTTLKSDIEKSHDFNLINDELQLKNYDNTMIQYRIKDQFILREHTIKTDTFKLNVVAYTFSESEASKPLSKTLGITIELLNDTITANYFLRKNPANVINQIYFNED